MYELDALIKTFEEHAKQSVLLREEERKRWKEFNPDQPMPEHMTEDFNFPEALASMCKEIDKLWIAIGGK